ncbi:MAG: TetR/AcrR family transcriptional regulator [Solirubrobacterales bacterium]|nr:TetR/AcrR family transcriptional regulator [Solirubrobacterales bacterium]
MVNFKVHQTPTRSYGGVAAADRVAARRARLLEAGLERFGTDGFAATGVKDVCRAAGLTDRYFYESFRDREALLVAVFDEVTDDLFARVAAAVAAAGPDPEPQLRAAVGTFLRALADDRRRSRVVFAEAASAGGEAERHMRATLRRFTDLVATTARRHLPAADEEEVRVLALSLVGTLHRAVIEWEDGALGLPLERVVDHCARLFGAVLR